MCIWQMKLSNKPHSIEKIRNKSIHNIVSNTLQLYLVNEEGRVLTGGKLHNEPGRFKVRTHLIQGEMQSTAATWRDNLSALGS